MTSFAYVFESAYGVTNVAPQTYASLPKRKHGGIDMRFKISRKFAEECTAQAKAEYEKDAF